jgi:hypothetical protein
MTTVCETYSKIFGYSLTSEDFSSAKLSILIGQQAKMPIMTSPSPNKLSAGVTSLTKGMQGITIQAIQDRSHEVNDTSETSSRSRSFSTHLYLPSSRVKMNIPYMKESRGKERASMESHKNPSSHSARVKTPHHTLMHYSSHDHNNNIHICPPRHPSKLDSSQRINPRDMNARKTQSLCSTRQVPFECGFWSDSQSLQVDQRHFEQNEKETKEVKEKQERELGLLKTREGDQNRDQHDLISTRMDVKNIPSGTFCEQRQRQLLDERVETTPRFSAKAEHMVGKMVSRVLEDARLELKEHFKTFPNKTIKTSRLAIRFDS